MSAWMASDDDFFVLRRFGKLGARVALYMQDQVVELEERLDKEEKNCMAEDVYLNNGTFRDDKSLERKDIMKDLSNKLERYRMNH